MILITVMALDDRHTYNTVIKINILHVVCSMKKVLYITYVALVLVRGVRAQATLHG